MARIHAAVSVIHSSLSMSRTNPSPHARRKRRSTAALQDAGALVMGPRTSARSWSAPLLRRLGSPRGSWSQCTAQNSWRLSMNQPTPNPSREGSRRSFASCQFPSWEGSGVGSWSQCTVARPRRLSRREGEFLAAFGQNQAGFVPDKRRDYPKRLPHVHSPRGLGDSGCSVEHRSVRFPALSNSARLQAVSLVSRVGHELDAAQKQSARQRVHHAVSGGVWIFRGTFSGGTGSALAPVVDWLRGRRARLAAIFGRGLLAAPARFGRRLAHLAALGHLFARWDGMGFIIDALADFPGADSGRLAGTRAGPTGIRTENDRVAADPLATPAAGAQRAGAVCGAHLRARTKQLRRAVDFAGEGLSRGSMGGVQQPLEHRCRSGNELAVGAGAPAPVVCAAPARHFLAAA